MRSVIIVLLLAGSATAAVYPVKSSGGSFTTISACAAVAVAGDTCRVFSSASPQSGWTQVSSGSAGNPITFDVNPGDTVVVNSAIALGATSYITIGGSASNAGFSITGGINFTTMSHVIIQNNNINNTPDRCITGPTSGNFVAASFNVIAHNIITYCGAALAQGIYLEGNNNLIDADTISHVEDGIALYGDRNVVRNTAFGPVVAAEYGSAHPDTLESSATCVLGNFDLPLTHMLYEGNTILNWGDSNAHTLLLRDSNSCGQTDNTVRLNSNINNGSYWISNDTNSLNERIYSNSVNITQASASPKDFNDLTFTNGDTGAKVKNNILTNMTRPANTDWCIYYDVSSATGFEENHNLCFMTGYSGTWKGPESTTSANHYAASDIFNSDPLYVNGSTDLHLQAGSPAIGAGGPLTTAVGGGSTSTALTVADAGYFQDGYSISGVQADWIRIGSSTTVQISSINYGTNVITLASAVSWSNGDSIYLYKNSSGTVVLNNASPDIGAFQFSSAVTPAKHHAIVQ